MTEKEKFLRKFNQAFVDKDLDFIFDSMTDDVSWTMVGDSSFSSKAEAREAMESMPDMKIRALTIKSVITHGAEAAVHGTISMITREGRSKTYAFCDLYKFNGFKDPKIRELTSFVLEVKSQGHPVVA